MDVIRQFGLQLVEVARHLGPIEVLDVAVVAFVLYQLLRLLRGTQGTQILVGLILLAVVGVVSTTFNLVLLSWLFRNATVYIIIAIILMFQPELRRALDQLGRIGDLRSHPGRGAVERQADRRLDRLRARRRPRGLRRDRRAHQRRDLDRDAAVDLLSELASP